MVDINQQINETSTTTSSNNEIQQQIPQMKQKTISLHFKKIIRHFHMEKKDWTYQNVAIFVIKVSFWIAIYILFGSLMISASIDLIQQYQENPIYLSMTANINQQTIPFPDVTVCLHFNVTEAFDAADTKNRDASETGQSSYNDLASFFSKYDESIKNGTTFWEILTEWPKTTNGVIVRYLIMMYEWEMLQDPAQHQFDLKQFATTKDDYWTAVRSVLIPKITEYNISIALLKATFQETFKGLRETANETALSDDCIFILDVGLSNETIYCVPSKLISFIGQDSICFRLESNYLPPASVQEDMPNYYMIHSGFKGSSWPLSLDFTDRSIPPPKTLPANETYYVFNLKGGYVYTFRMNITLLYISQPGSTKTCAPDSTREECQYLCRSKQINKLCDCAPVTYSNNYASASFTNCTFDKYANCSKYLGNEENNCTNSCVPNCKKWYYEFEVTSFSSTDKRNKGRRRVAMFMMSFDYLIITETYTWTFELFIGALGGVIGIWLGLDFGVLIEFVFKPTMMLIRKLLSLKGRTEEEFETNEFEQSKYRQKIIRARHKYGTSRPLVATWYFEKLFWTILYTSGGISTAIYCWNLMKQYSVGDTQFTAAIFFNKSIILPEARLCFDLSQGPLFYAPFESEVGKQMVLTYELKKYLTNQTAAIRNRDIFLDPKKNWPESLIFASYLYVGVLTYYELKKEVVVYNSFDLQAFPQSNGSGFNGIYQNIEIMGFEMNDLENALSDILLPKLLEWNVSVDELRQKVGKELFKILNVSISFYNSSTSKKSIVLKNPRTELIITGQICYTLPMDEILFIDNSEFFEISTVIKHKNFFSGQLMLDFSGTSFVQNPGFLGSGPAHLAEMYSAIVTARYGKTTNFSFTMDSFYSSLPVARGVEQCVITPVGPWPCYYNSLKEQCNCTPTANPLVSSPPSPEFPECNTRIYNICGLLSPQMCNNTELPQCKTWYFTFAETVSTNDLVFSKNESYESTVVRIFVADFTYVSIEEQRVFTLKQFLAAFGGMLGIWLGLSFFSLVQFVNFPVEFVFGLLLRKANEKFSAMIDPQKNSKVKKTIQSRWWLNIEYIFDFEFDEFRKQLNLQKIALYPAMAILFFAGSIETITLCTDLFHRYSIGETTSTVIFMNNDTFSLPKSTICLPINITDFKVTESQKKFFHEEPVKEIYNCNGKDVLLNTNWSYSLLQLSFEYFAVFAHVERYGSFEVFLNVSNLTYDSNTTFRLLETNWTAIQIFNNHIRSLNITVEELKQKCGTEFKKLISVNVKHFDTNYNKTLELVKETTFIDETTICYKLQLDEVIFTSKKGRLSLFVNKELLPDFEKNSSLTIHLNGTDDSLNQGSPRDSTVITAQFGELSFFEINIRAMYLASSYSNGAVKCSHDETLVDCQDSCRIAMIQKFCNCVPVSWSRLVARIDEFCTLDDYINCSQFSSTYMQYYESFRREFSNCSSNCLPYCTLIKYVQHLETSPVGPDHAEVIIKILQFPYLVYSEDFVYTFNSFISEFGGDIGLWIGLDFLFLTRICYFASCILLRLIMVSIKKNAISDDEETSALSAVHDPNNQTMPPVQSPETVLRVISIE